MKTNFKISMMVMLITMVACKKENRFKEDSSGRSSSSAYVFYPENTTADMLDDFWSNYGAYKNVSIPGLPPANLAATLNKEDALYVLHYALNVGMVNVDSTMEDEYLDSVSYSMSFTNEAITKQDLCVAVDNMVTSIKNLVNASELTNKRINSLTLSYNAEENPVNITATFLVTGGALWSTPNFNDAANQSFDKFNNSIPWITQKSYLDYSNGNSPILYPHADSKIHPVYLFDGTLIPSGDEYAARLAAWNKLPGSTIKAVHHYLTSNGIFWPDPVAQLQGWFPSYQSGYKPVKSPTPSLHQKADEDVSAPGWDIVIPLDVLDCTGNPSFQGAGGIPTPTSMEPSKILSWYDIEHAWQLQSIRTVAPATINYFWNNRLDVARVAQGKAAGKIANGMGVAGHTGYYAMTNYSYKPVTNEQWQGLCGGGTVCNAGNVCLHSAEYYLYWEFDHFTTQRMTPSQLAQYF